MPGGRGGGRRGALLVDLPNWVGDVAMALPAVARLAAAGWERVTLHCRPPVARWLERLFPGAEVVATRRREAPWAAARRLLAGSPRFAVGVTLRHATRAKLLLRLAARRSVGSHTGGGALLLTDPVTVDRSRHQVHDADPMLERLGLEPADPLWRPGTPEALRAEGRAALAAAGVEPERAVGLAPAAAWGPSKRWPPARFGDLARRLAERGREPVVLVGPGEEALAAEVAAAAGRDLPVVGPGLDVAGLCGVLAHLPAVVANDSGPMHLAALAGCRLVALYGPTDPRRTAPLGDGHAVISLGLPCAPCLEPVCPLGHGDCLARIGADEVLAALEGG